MRSCPLYAGYQTKYARRHSRFRAQKNANFATLQPAVTAVATKHERTDMKNGPAHYNCLYRRKLTDKDIEEREAHIKLDPYRICEVWGVKGGAREQIIKKGLRWTSKGDSVRKVIQEIVQACERHLEMLDEDAGIDGAVDVPAECPSPTRAPRLPPSFNPPPPSFTAPRPFGAPGDE